MKKSIELKNLTIGFSEKEIVKDIQAQLIAGDIAVILGKNGSGKSTLLKTIFNNLKPLSGNIYIQDKPQSSIEISKNIAIVLSKFSFPRGITVYDLISHGRYPYHQWYDNYSELELTLINQTITLLQLENEKNKKLEELSDGNLQKVAIARAIVQDTPIIILDEPLTHLDVPNQFAIIKALQYLAKEKNKTILFSSHDWSQSLQIANKLWFIKDQSFYSGFTEDIAIEHHLVEYFSDKNYTFDYCFNQYAEKANKPKTKVSISVDKFSEEKNFWLNKALMKSGFEISKLAEINIEVAEKEFKIKTKTRKYNCNKIEQLINFIKNED